MIKTQERGKKMKLPERIASGHSAIRMVPKLICVVAVATLLFPTCGQKAEEAPREVIRPVKTTTVSAATDIFGLTLSGTVRASQRVELAFKEVGGRLIEVPIEGREGQAVKQDELLAGIDPKDFETSLRNVQGRFGYLDLPALNANVATGRPQCLTRNDRGRNPISWKYRNTGKPDPDPCN